jgi:hypothetical protein
MAPEQQLRTQRVEHQRRQEELEVQLRQEAAVTDLAASEEEAATAVAEAENDESLNWSDRRGGEGDPQVLRVAQESGERRPYP